MKIRVSTALSRNESEVLRDLSKAVGQTPKQFVRTAVNAAFDQLIEDGHPVAWDDGSRVAWNVYAKEYEIRGGSSQVAEFLVRKGRAA